MALFWCLRDLGSKGTPRRLLHETAFLRDDWKHVALFWRLRDLGSKGTPLRLLHETAFLRGGAFLW